MLNGGSPISEVAKKTKDICIRSKRNEDFQTTNVERIFLQESSELCRIAEGNNQLTVFELAEDVALNENAYPACLHNGVDVTNQTVEIAGFGKELGQDTRFLPNVGILKKNNYNVVDCEIKKMLCTKLERGGMPCAGDTGFGVVFRDHQKNEAMVVGVVGGQPEACWKKFPQYQTGMDDLFGRNEASLVHNRVEDNLAFICISTGICYHEAAWEGGRL